MKIPCKIMTFDPPIDGVLIAFDSYNGLRALVAIAAHDGDGYEIMDVPKDEIRITEEAFDGLQRSRATAARC